METSIYLKYPPLTLHTWIYNVTKGDKIKSNKKFVQTLMYAYMQEFQYWNRFLSSDDKIKLYWNFLDWLEAIFIVSESIESQNLVN